MMTAFEKRIDFVLNQSLNFDILEKYASSNEENISPEIKKHIKNLKPDKNFLYVLSTPLGASEYYGPNNNGDVFYEEALNPKEPGAYWGYKSFETIPARVNIKHFNKDPDVSVGEIEKSAYNNDLHRVEVIMKIDRNKVPEIVEKIERAEEKRASGEKVADEDNVHISMGCKLVDGDVCSICKNRAKTKLEYCEHLAEKMGEVLPDGRRVVAENPKPLFFDLSIVDSPAAKESAVLKKVAYDLNKKETSYPEIRNMKSEDRETQKIKNKFKEFSLSEERFSVPLLDKMAQEKIEDIFGTLNSLGIILKPEEFQYLMLSKSNHQKLAKNFHKNNTVFAPTYTSDDFDLTEETFNEKIASFLGNKFKTRTIFDPYLSLRLNEKTAESKNLKVSENPMLIKISRLYNGYRDYLNNNINEEKIAERLRKEPQSLKYILDTVSPDVKMASFNQFGDADKISKSIFSKIQRMYLLFG